MSVRRNRRGRAPRRGGSSFGTSLRLGLLFATLLGINVYVFLLRGDTALPEVLRQSALPAQVRETRAPAPQRTPAAPPRVVEGEVEPGQSFGGILTRVGVEGGQAHALIVALRREVDFRQLRPGARYRLELAAADASPLGGELKLSATDTVRFVREGEDFAVDRVREALHTEVEALAGEIESSLYDSVEALGEDPSIVSTFVDVFAWDLDFYVDQHPGDRFRMIVEKQYLRGTFHRYGRILAAEYDGEAGRFRAFWHNGDGAPAGYYDEQGRSVERSLLKTPLQYVRISSRFGRRYHPILHRVKGHMGVDFAAPAGTPVRATAPGRVTFAGRNGGSGNMVVVGHANGYTSLYMHLARFARGVHTDKRVEQREVIGYVGQTGLATGPHLHFGLQQGGRYVDPLRVRGSRGKPLTGAAREAFVADVEQRAARLAGVDVQAPQRREARGLSTR